MNGLGPNHPSQSSVKNPALPGGVLYFLLLLFILPTLGGCYFPGHPRYQPFSLKNVLSAPLQGYKDIPIDERTYLVRYDGYYSHSPQHGFLLWTDVLDEKWLQGAQEYTLYRAGELAKSKGEKYFIVLYKDDWNLMGALKGKYGPIISTHPGASLMVRVLSDYPSSMQPNDDRVYEVDKLLQSLAEKNSGLAEHHNKTPSDESTENTGYKFSRWRSSVSGYDSVPVPGHWEKPWLVSAYFKFESGISTTKGPNGNFQVAGWVDYFRPSLPLSLLRDCVLLAEGMGFEVFKLKNWTVEEHRDRDSRKVWFRTTAEVVLQHQKESDSLHPVFVVDEIRSNVMNYEW